MITRRITLKLPAGFKAQVIGHGIEPTIIVKKVEEYELPSRSKTTYDRVFDDTCVQVDVDEEF